MGACKYCGQKANFFSNVHKECVQKYEDGQLQIVAKISEFILVGGDSDSVEANINEIANKAFITRGDLSALFSKGFDTAIARLTTTDFISEDAEHKINDFFRFWNKVIGGKILVGESYSKVLKSIILRDLLHGSIPTKMDSLKQSLPFNFLKNEKLIWTETNVAYCEQKTKTYYQGGSNGISVRIAKGLYYRTNSFKGYPVQTTSMVSYGTGTIAVTDQSIYYSSQLKTFRVKIDKIVAFHPYSNAIGFEKDGASAKPQLFNNIDGTFYYNLFTNIANVVAKAT